MEEKHRRRKEAGGKDGESGDDDECTVGAECAVSSGVDIFISYECVYATPWQRWLSMPKSEDKAEDGLWYLHLVM